MEENNAHLDDPFADLGVYEEPKDYKKCYAFFSYSNHIGYCEQSCDEEEDCHCKKLPALDTKYVDALRLALYNSSVKIISDEVWFLVEPNDFQYLSYQFKNFKSLCWVGYHFFIIYVHQMYYEETRLKVSEYEPGFDESLLNWLPDWKFESLVDEFPGQPIYEIRKKEAVAVANANTTK